MNICFKGVLLILALIASVSAKAIVVNDTSAVTTWIEVPPVGSAIVASLHSVLLSNQFPPGITRSAEGAAFMREYKCGNVIFCNADLVQIDPFFGPTQIPGDGVATILEDDITVCNQYSMQTSGVFRTLNTSPPVVDDIQAFTFNLLIFGGCGCI